MRRYFKGRILAVEIRGSGDSSWGTVRLDDGQETNWANCSTEYATTMQKALEKHPGGVEIELQTQITVSRGYLRERVIEPRRAQG